MEHTTGTVTVQALESRVGTAYKNPGDVDFCVQYPEGYAGPRLMPEGVVTVSRESAEQFTRMGIGSVVAPPADPADPAAEESKAPEVKTEAPKKKGKQ